MAFFALTFLDNVLQTARTVMMNHDLANQMIEDIAEINFLEICCQAGFVEPHSTEKFKDSIQDCKTSKVIYSKTFLNRTSLELTFCVLE